MCSVVKFGLQTQTNQKVGNQENQEIAQLKNEIDDLKSRSIWNNEIFHNVELQGHEICEKRLSTKTSLAILTPSILRGCIDYVHTIPIGRLPGQL